MGAYLSTPKRDKESHDGENDKVMIRIFKIIFVAEIWSL
jgi:hypothetical protein